MTLPGARALSPAMYGREPQLDSLVEHLKQANNEGGRIVFVSGDAGIGKTRLTGEFLRRFSDEEDGHALLGQCYDADPAVPYGPFLDALLQLIEQKGTQAVANAAGPWAVDLQPILPDLAPYIEKSVAEIDPRIQKRRLFEALFRVLAASSDQVRVVVLEDLQWSDASTQELLPFIGARIKNRPLLLVGTYRSDELHRRHPFIRTLNSLAREPAFYEIKLDPLSPGDVEHMLEAILDQPLAAGFVESFYAQTGGNPFFVEELLKSVVESGHLQTIIEAANKGRGLGLVDIPTTIVASVLTRTDALAEEEQTTLRNAAVIGRRFGYDMLQRLTGLEEQRLVACLRQLMRVQLIEEAGGEGDWYQFRHALTREAVYDALVHRERRLIHRQILAVLETLNEQNLERAADRLAYHSLMARDLEKGRSYARMAGREAMRKLAHREAVAHLETALELTEEGDARKRADLFNELGMAAYPIGDTRLYSRYWAEARTLYQQLGEEQKAAQISLRLSRLAWERGDSQEAFSRAREALAAYQEEDRGEDVALAYSVISQLHMLASQYEEAIHWGRRALEMAREVGSIFVQVHALNNLGMSHHEQGEIEQGISLLEQSYDLAVGLAGDFERIRAGNNLAESLFANGNLTRARRVLEEALEAADRGELQLHRSFLEANLGSVAVEQGRWDEADMLLTQSLKAAELGLPIVRLFAAPWKAELLRRRGQLDETLAIIDESLPHAEKHGEFQFVRLLLAVLVRAHYDRGNDTTTDEILDRSIELAADHPVLVGSVPFLTDVAELLTLRGRMREAKAIMEAVGALQERTNLWIIEARMRRVDGLRQEREGHLDLAADSLRAAVELWQGNGYPYQEAIDRRSLARVLAAEDSQGEAQRQAEGAAEILRQLGAAEDLATLGRTGLEGREQEPAEGIAGEVEQLTPREVEVLHHLSQGKSNRDIAEALVISVKTVEVHVSNVLGKLGVSSRTEAAALAASRGWLQDERSEAPREDP